MSDEYLTDGGTVLLVHGAVLALMVHLTGDYTVWGAVYFTLLNGILHIVAGVLLE